MTKDERERYERARKEGDGRFGFVCRHELLRGGRCVSRAFTASSDTFSAGGDNPEPTQQRWLKERLQQQRKPALSAPDTTWKPEISRGSMPRM